MRACSRLHWLYLSGRIKGVFASSHARVRDARHWRRTQSESIFPLLIVHFPISPFAGTSRSGSRPRRLKESVYILCGCPTSWKTMKMLAGCSFHRFKNGELRLKRNKLREQFSYEVLLFLAEATYPAILICVWHAACSFLITWLRIGGTGCRLHLCTHTGISLSALWQLSAISCINKEMRKI